MKFSVFFPPGISAAAPAPLLFYLSGLTCTDENVVQKAGASRAAAAHGVALVCPDTSPRHDASRGLPGEDAHWDFGKGAGFYLDATAKPWCQSYRMETYVARELRDLLATKAGPFAALDSSRASLTGHSMGGHGALTLAFKDPEAWASTSAFSPICHPTNCPWGRKAFGGYLAGGQEEGANHDASLLMRRDGPGSARLRTLPILVDQGTSDSFLVPSDANGPHGQLQPEALIAAMVAAGRTDAHTAVRMQLGYDHSYHFIASFIDDHIAFAAKNLKK